MQNNWTKEELKASVEVYLEIQRRLRSGQKVIKQQYYRDLASKYGRTESSYRNRMKNISYVLSLEDREWIPGLKPFSNVGANVATLIEDILAEIEKQNVTDTTQEKPSGNKSPQSIKSLTTDYERDASVKAWVLDIASGLCECCNQPAPFITVEGTPFLEVHHVCRLADGGSDTVENAVAICPNCHRELHYGADRDKLIEHLYNKNDRLVRE